MPRQPLQERCQLFRWIAKTPTGAGDAFLAALVHCLCKDGFDSLSHAEQLQQTMQYASAAGALTTLRPGAMAAQPQAEEGEGISLPATTCILNWPCP